MQKWTLHLAAVSTLALSLTVHCAEDLFGVPGLEARLNITGYGAYIDSENSILNPDNKVADLPERLGKLELRPDFFWKGDWWDLQLGPRAEAEVGYWRTGVDTHTTRDEHDVFINRWLARVDYEDKLFLAVGRQDMQWGPAFLFSPSNPFNSSNGRDNVKLEEPGLDYAWGDWVISDTFTLSVIANLYEGEAEIDDFENVYVVKLDVTGNDWSGAVLASYRENTPDPESVGMYGSVNAGEAIVLYTEGTVPVCAPEDLAWLAGGSYSFTNGTMVSMEYLFNAAGKRGSHLDNLMGMTWNNSYGGERPFARKNYLFAQLYHEFTDDLALTLRETVSLDDFSQKFVGLVEFDLTDNLELFALGQYESGGEFGAFLRFGAMGGFVLRF